MISTLLTTLLIINSIVLIFLIVVLQQGNEGGLGGSLGGGNSQGFFGASGGVKTIIRATWICGVLFFGLAMSSAWVKTHERYELKNNLEKSLSEHISPVGPINPSTPIPSKPNPKPDPLPKEK
jgi:preprotein translocase subunit SecG